MTYIDLVNTIAEMTPVSIDSSDDVLEDCVATINRLIEEARKTQRAGVIKVYGGK